MAQLSGVGVAVMVGGGLLLFAGLKNFTPLEGLRSIAGGKNPASTAAASTSSLASESAQLDAAVSAAYGSGSAPAADAPSGGAAPATGSAIADAALKYEGVPYKYGGTSPQTGFDCSGFIQYVLTHDLGIPGVPRTIGAQNLWPGAVGVGQSQVQAGDLVLWPYGAGPDAHGGIVVAPGSYVNAPYTGAKVRVDPIPGTLHGGPPVYKRVLGAHSGVSLA